MPFVKLALVPVSHAFRRMVWDPDGCDKHGHRNMAVRETRDVDTSRVRDARDVEQVVDFSKVISGEADDPVLFPNDVILVKESFF